MQLENKAEQLRNTAADSLADAADSVRRAGAGSAENITELTDGAGRKLDCAATYVRTFGNLESLRNRVRKNPVESVSVAMALGLVTGIFCFRRKSCC